MSKEIKKTEYVCARCGICACDECFKERMHYPPNIGSRKCRVCNHPHRVSKAEYWKRREN